MNHQGGFSALIRSVLDSNFQPPKEKDIRKTVEHEWTVTNSKSIKCECLWSIENYRKAFESSDKLISPEFTSNDDHKLKWQLELSSRSDSEYVDLCLLFVEWKEVFREGKVIFSILNNDQVKETIFFVTSKEKRINLPSFFNNQQLLDKSNNFLPDDTLTILCELRQFGRFTRGGLMEPIIDVKKSQLSEDYDTILGDKKFSDLTIVDVNGKEIAVHKMILSARSQHFKKCLETDMEEEVQSRLVIDNLDPVVLFEMLRFIYTDTVPKMEEISEKLLVAANIYLLERLKNLCESFLLSKLNVSNAVDTFILATSNKATQLGARTFDFIQSNLGDVQKSDGWANMVKNHSQLVLEYFQYELHINGDKSNYRKYSCAQCG